jgi:hypothetical protein
MLRPYITDEVVIDPHTSGREILWQNQRLSEKINSESFWEENEKYKHKTLTEPELLDADHKMYMHVPYNIQ